MCSLFILFRAAAAQDATTSMMAPRNVKKQTKFHFHFHFHVYFYIFRAAADGAEEMLEKKIIFIFIFMCIFLYFRAAAAQDETRLRR